MIQLCSPRSHFAACLLLLASLAGMTAPSCMAAQSAPLASVVIDADSGEVLHAANANRRVRPASLTKLMTALLVMQYLTRDEPVLDALLVASANDAAVVAAEAIAGDEVSFAQRMNEAAAELGLTRTRFANASGLPAKQFTTARDIAVLARHLWRAFPAQRKRYSQTGMTYAGRWVGTTNPLLGSYRGARGMKTGFTCRAGFHLVGAAERDGRTLIAVVLGAQAPEARVRSIRKLLNDAFKSRSTTSTLNVDALADATGQGENMPVSVAIIARACLVAKRPSGWSIDVGVRRTKKEARALAKKFIRAHRKALRGARAASIPRFRGVTLHRALVTRLDEDRARATCLEYRKQGGSCIIFGPKVAAAQLEKLARIRTLAKMKRAAASKAKPG